MGKAERTSWYSAIVVSIEDQHLYRRQAVVILTEVHPRVGCAPLNVAAGSNAVIEVVVREDRSHLGIPWSAQRTLVGDIESVVGLCNMAVVDVHAVLVLESGVAALPCCDATTATTELDLRVGDPQCTKAWS